MRIPSPFCLFDRHQPQPERIRQDWLESFGTCRHCGRGIRLRKNRFWVAIKPRERESRSI